MDIEPLSFKARCCDYCLHPVYTSLSDASLDPRLSIYVRQAIRTRWGHVDIPAQHLLLNC